MRCSVFWGAHRAHAFTLPVRSPKLSRQYAPSPGRPFGALQSTAVELLRRTATVDHIPGTHASGGAHVGLRLRCGAHLRTIWPCSGCFHSARLAAHLCAHRGRCCVARCQLRAVCQACAGRRSCRAARRQRGAPCSGSLPDRTCVDAQGVCPQALLPSFLCHWRTPCLKLTHAVGLRACCKRFALL